MFRERALGKLSVFGFQRWRKLGCIVGVSRPRLSRLASGKSRNLSGLFLQFNPLFIGFVVLVLAACGQVPGRNSPSALVAVQGKFVSFPSNNDVAGGVFVKGIRLGGLTIAPTVPGSAQKHLGLTWSQAAKLFESSVSEQGPHINAILGFGVVSSSGPNSMLGGIRLDHRPAWVGIGWGEITSCPAEISKRPGTLRGAVTPIYSVVVIFANGGLGAVSYDTRGQPPCGGALVGPTISPGRKVESVPWTLKSIDSVGALLVSFNASVCAEVFSESASGSLKTKKFTVTVDVSVPFNPRGCSTQETRQALIQLFPPSPGIKTGLPIEDIIVGHGPTGIVPVLQMAKVLGGGS